MYEFSQPWILILWFVPLLIYKLLPAVEVQYQFALRVPFFDQWVDSTSHQKNHQNIPWFWHCIGIWFFLVLALAGPRWIGTPLPLAYETHDVMLVLDISGSMGLEDMPSSKGYQSRWQVVRKTALDFVKKRTEDKIGLILFGEHSYLFAPLTLDKTTLAQRINDAEVGLAGQATALGDAIGLGIKHLKNTPEKGRVMVLLTDGVTNAGILPPEKAAEIAKAEKIKIYAIGLGPQTQGKSLSSIFWQLQQSSDLDEKTLKSISSLTKGQYFRASDEKSLEKIYQQIDKLEPVEQKREDLCPQKQYFYIPLSIAFFWMMILFIQQIWRDRLWSI
jgi:Ca-activated chloride channel family protein